MCDTVQSMCHNGGHEELACIAIFPQMLLVILESASRASLNDLLHLRFESRTSLARE